MGGTGETSAATQDVQRYDEGTDPAAPRLGPARAGAEGPGRTEARVIG